MRRLGLNLVVGLSLSVGCDSVVSDASDKAGSEVSPRSGGPIDCSRCPAAVGGGSSKPPVDRGDIKVAYNKTDKKRLRAFGAMIKDSGVIESVVAGVNELIALPRDSAILVAQCNEPNAYYDPKAPGIVLCYELIRYFNRLFRKRVSEKELANVVTGAVLFGLLHELGHALVHQLDLPITGREEDAVDQLAAVILIESGSRLAMALDGAQAFMLHSRAVSKQDRTPFWDEHSFEEQRYYNIVCLAYGSDPKKLGYMVSRGDLPKQRAKLCPAEYQRVRRSWTRLLAPHSKA